VTTLAHEEGTARLDVRFLGDTIMGVEIFGTEKPDEKLNES
jgi:hypothetical protein